MHIPSFQTRTAEQRRLEQVFPNYSIAKVLRHMMAGEPLDGYEADVEAQFGGSAGTGNRFGPTITVPWGVLSGRRDLNIGSPTAGGFLVGNTMGPAADVIRPYNVATRAGMTVLSGLRTDVPIPSVMEEVEFAWMIDETSPGPSLTPATGLVQMRPHVACGLITFSDRLVRGMPPGVLDLFVRRRLMLAAGALIDRVVLDGRTNRGSAVADDMAEPLGLCNIVGVPSYSATNASGLLIGALNSAMTVVASRAGSDDGCSFIMHPGMRQSMWANTVGYNDLMSADGRVHGKTVHSTSGMAANAGAYGDWSSAVLGLWGEGIELAVDVYSGFKNNTITMRCMVAMDVAFPNPGAFGLFRVTT